MSQTETLPLPTLGADASVLEAAKLMVSERSSEVFVVDAGGKPIGIVRQADVVRSVAEGTEPAKTTLGEVMLHPPPTVEEDASVGEISKVIARADVRRILVRRDRKIIGVVEAGELFGLVSATMEKVEVLKAVSVRARLRMAELLSVKPMSVDELADELGIKPITVRHHLDVLRRSGMIEERQQDTFGKVGRPLSLFSTNKSVLKRGALS